MSAAPQFIACKFRENDTRTYTYRNDGEPVLPGDKVMIADRHGDGMQKIFVVDVDVAEPSFECKPILGLHRDEPTELDLGDDDDWLTSRAA